ncbi:MAG: HD domain-containing protein [Candidatus Eremiobacteraeota bacterium]|nr:HD domain-containing protein [Candidatus Eremiobacteraeota bacterium]
MKHPLDECLASVLPPGSLYSVGGRVRDEVRHALQAVPLTTQDQDYVVTGLTLVELTRRLEPLGRVDLVGASFAVMKLSTEFGIVDVALPRQERSSGTGHREFAVESAVDIPIEVDLARRDFRMNMLARALPEGRLVDPYGGVADIEARRIDILTPQAFAEDPLRMLRACQFAARFAYAPTQGARVALQEAAPLVSTVAAERVGEELAKMLRLAPRPSVGLELMRETGLLARIWPELLEGVGVPQNEWHAFEVYRHNLETVDATPPGDLILRLAALLHDVAKPRVKDGPHFYRHEHEGETLVTQMLQRVRFPNDVVAAVGHLVRQHMFTADPTLSDAGIRRFIRRVGPANVGRQFALREADIIGSGLPKRDDSNEAFARRVLEELERKPAFSLKDLRIDGRTVVTIMRRLNVVGDDFTGDARVGAALQHAFEQVTDCPDDNEPSKLAALIERYFKAHPA